MRAPQRWNQLLLFGLVILIAVSYKNLINKIRPATQKIIILILSLSIITLSGIVFASDEGGDIDVKNKE